MSYADEIHQLKLKVESQDQEIVALRTAVREMAAISQGVLEKILIITGPPRRRQPRPKARVQ